MHYKKCHSQVQLKIQSGLPKASEEVAREASTSHTHCRDKLGFASSPLLPPAGQAEEQHSERQKLYYPRQQYWFELCCL